MSQLVVDFGDVGTFNGDELHGADLGIDEDVDAPLVLALGAGFQMAGHIFINEPISQRSNSDRVANGILHLGWVLVDGEVRDDLLGLQARKFSGYCPMRPNRKPPHDAFVSHHDEVGFAARWPHPDTEAFEVFIIVIDVSILWFEDIYGTLGYLDHVTQRSRMFGYRDVVPHPVLGYIWVTVGRVKWGSDGKARRQNPKNMIYDSILREMTENASILQNAI